MPNTNSAQNQALTVAGDLSSRDEWEFIDFPNEFEPLPLSPLPGGATEPSQTEQNVKIIASWFRWSHQVMRQISIEHMP